MYRYTLQRNPHETKSNIRHKQSLSLYLLYVVRHTTPSRQSAIRSLIQLPAIIIIIIITTTGKQLNIYIIININTLFTVHMINTTYNYTTTTTTTQSSLQLQRTTYNNIHLTLTLEGILKESDFFKLLRKGANFGKLIYTYI